MFKTVANRVAHNTTIPGLGGNSDLRPLQDLITSEKTVIIALQKLSTDYSKAAESLRTWGQAEGDDLGVSRVLLLGVDGSITAEQDILSASTALLTQFSSALTQYAGHGHAIREHLKTIRSREEALDELRRRRRTVARKAEDADKKLHKMSPEHKNLDTQTELLHRLQDEIRTLDSDIMTEEASLGDFKRSSTRSWLGLKFGGLLECCEKGAIIGQYGKMLVSEIPEDVTQPGMPRNMYYGHSKINAIRERSDARRERSDDFGFTATTALAPEGTGTRLPHDPIGTSRAPALDIPSLSSPVDDFGNMRTEPNSTRFATFPVKLRQDSLPTHPAPFLPPISQGPPSLLTTRDDIGDSLSLSIAEALDGKKEAVGEGGGKAWRSEFSESKVEPPSPKPTSPPPPGDASTNPWATPPGQQSSLPVHRKEVVSQISDDDNALLAYMTSADADGLSDSDEDEPRRPPPKIQEPAGETGAGKKSSEMDSNATAPFRPVSVKVEIEGADEQPQPKKKQSIPRIPPPTFDPEEDKPKEDEKEQKALDAAAARALSQEITLTDFVPPKLSSPIEESGEEEESRGRDLAPASSAGHSQGTGDQSPLLPPSAPFAQRAVSPQPSYTDQPRTAAQAYAQSYQQTSTPSSAQPSPTSAQSYAQSYQQGGGYPQQNQYGAPSQNLPPRLQAFQPAEPGMPPRFQGTRTGSSPIPSRFQAPQDTRFSAEQSRVSLETPYRTPAEEFPPSTTSSPRLGHTPATSSAPSSPPKSTSSRLQPAMGGFGSAGSSPLASPIPAGARTISASAFKRPQPLPQSSIDSFGGSLPDPRRNLPAAPSGAAPSQPQPPQSYGSTPVGGVFPGSAASQAPLPSPYVNEPTSYQSQPQQPPPPHHRISRDLPPPPPGAALARPETEYDYGFDFSAYEGNSPVAAEFPGGAGQRMSGGGGGPRPGSYYGTQQQQQQGGYGGYGAPGYGQAGGYGGSGLR
ncbi:hypothetical protein NMY22_g748 [Coprinellus aureogranulatus]|nr:hypothetical protein NMY22_g748 [Coprinellus aureogranulatus]